MDIASACLAGKKCRYDGEAREHPYIKRLYEQGKVKAVCPECLAGFKTPRCPCEISGEGAAAVLDGTAKVIARDGADLTREFIEGAQKTLAAAIKCGAKRAYMKSKSPSCGVSSIYDGTFSGRLKPGSGVASELLTRNGIEVVEF